MSGRPYAEVIGDPIAHSKSPLIHGFWLEKLGIAAEYRRCHVRAEELGEYFARRRGDAEWRGCNVTIPHKENAISLADLVDRSAGEVGAANCIVSENGKLVAYNFDTVGISAAVCVGHSSVCIIGAGGAARAIIPSLDILSVYDFRIVVRDRNKGIKLSNEFDGYQWLICGFEDPSEAFVDVDGVINASPLGMVGKPPMPATILDSLELVLPDAYVFDMVYDPLETELLKRARAQGLEAIDGLVMLIGQAKGSFRKFFGVFPPDSADAELRALLTA